MTAPSPSFAARLFDVWPGAALGVLMIVTCLPEMVQWISDMGWTGTQRWRILFLQYGAFWPGLLQDWQPNYRFQPWAMFFTYSFLHSGPAHLLGNMLVLLWLGPLVMERLGGARFFILWALSALGGAVAFALLSNGVTPMVGASGSIFGLMGAYVVLHYGKSGRFGAVVLITAALIALNIVTFIVEDGLLAWQTHLGGYITGALVALALSARPRPSPA